MESIGIPNSPSGLELTIATPVPGNGIHISSSFGSGDKLANHLTLSMPAKDGCDGSNTELTIATPAPGNGIHIFSSSSCSDVCNGSTIENARELTGRLLTQSVPAKDVCNGSNIENPREIGSLLTPSDRPKDGSNIEKSRELALLDRFHLPDVLAISNMEIEGGQERQPAGGSSYRPHKYKRLSQEQRQLLESSFQQNQYPDKGRKEALAETLKMTLNQVKAWFVNHRARLKKQKMEDNNEKGLDNYKRQVESLTNETRRLRHKLNKLKKKLNKKRKAPSMAPLPPPQLPEQQQQQVMYVPVLTRFVPNREHNVATTVTTALITQQGSASATVGSPITNALLLPSSDASAI